MRCVGFPRVLQCAAPTAAGQITPSGTVTEFSIPGENDSPVEIAAGSKTSGGRRWHLVVSHGPAAGETRPAGAAVSLTLSC